MFKLDNDFLQSLGLGGLPVDEKNRLLQMIYERLEMNVGMRLAEKMTDQQLDEFEAFIDQNDEAGALKWLETNFPNYKDVVAEELEKLKGEVTNAAPQILAAQGQGAGVPQSGQPQPQYAQQQPQQGYAPQPMQQQGYAPQPQAYSQAPQYQPGFPAEGPGQPGFPAEGPGQPGFPAEGPGQQLAQSQPFGPVQQPGFTPPIQQQPQYQQPAPIQQPYQPPVPQPQQPSPQQSQPGQPQQFTPPPPGFNPQ